jgi:hypothetical protein
MHSGDSNETNGTLFYSPDAAVTTSFGGVIYRLSDGTISGMTKVHALSLHHDCSQYC